MTVEVEILEDGTIHPVSAETKLPAGRAFLTTDEPIDHSCYLLSEKSLEDWLRPEEDEAWAYLQPVK